MLSDQLSFVFPADQGFSELISSLESTFAVRRQQETVFYRVFYDTVDWLLYNNGAVLELHEKGQSRRIYWRAGKKDRLKIQLGLKQVPELASELPAGEFRKQLASVISVRELGPRIRLKVKRIALVVLNRKDKVVVRINLDETWFYPARTRAGALLGRRLCITPVKGYDDAYQQVQAFFRRMDLPPAEDNMLKLALAESGTSTVEHTTKLNLFLDPDMPAENAMKQILLRLLEIMQQNTAGSIRGNDTEFMHDYRVSIRKTRSALSLIKNVLPKKAIKKYSKFFSSLGKLTTPVRDLDVFLIKLDTYKRKLGKASQAQLAPLRQYLQDKRAAAQSEYVQTVKSDQYRQMIAAWRDYLQSPEPVTPALENTQKPVLQLANELIWGTYQMVLEEGNAITDKSPAEDLHELRKSCKKLRYLIEFFQSLYPAAKIRELINALKGLQDNLGDFNDYHVHMEILKGFNENSTDEAATRACNKLIKTLRRKQQSTRDSFAARFTAFSSDDNQNEFRALFVLSAHGDHSQ